MLRPEHCWYALVLAFKDGNTTWSHAWGQPLSLPKEVLKPPPCKSCGYQKTLGSSDTPRKSPDYSLLGLLTVHNVASWLSPHLRRALLFLPHHQLPPGQVQHSCYFGLWVLLSP